MLVCPRWEKVREYGPQCGRQMWGPSYLLDTRAASRGWSDALRVNAESGEWWKNRRGVWLHVRDILTDERGMAGFSGSVQFPGPILGITSSSSTLPAFNTLALSNSYTYNTSPGNAIAARIMAPSALTLNSMYYYITAAATGTQANINDINAEFRDTTANGGKPGTTLHASGVADPNGEATWIGWHKIGGMSFALVAGTHYWGVIADADGNGTDNATVQSSWTLGLQNYGTEPYFGVDTITGFNSAPTARTSGSIVFEFSGGTVYGCSIAVSAASTSGTQQRGLYMGGLTETLKVFALIGGTLSNNISGGNIWTAGAGPSGSADVATTTNYIAYGVSGRSGAYFAGGVTLAKATAYRLVWTYSAAATAPGKLSTGTQNGYGSTLNKAMLGGVTGWYWAEANGTTNWNNDDITGYPFGGLLVEDQIAAGSAPYMLRN